MKEVCWANKIVKAQLCQGDIIESYFLQMPVYSVAFMKTIQSVFHGTMARYLRDVGYQNRVSSSIKGYPAHLVSGSQIALAGFLGQISHTTKLFLSLVTLV